MISDFAMKGKKNIFYLFKKIKFDLDFIKENPCYFRPDGFIIYWQCILRLNLLLMLIYVIFLL